MLIDKEHVKRSFKKSISTYNDNAIVQKHICKHLTDLVNAYGQCNFSDVLEIGCGTGLMTENIIDNFSVDNIIINDIVEEMSNEISSLLETKMFKKYKFISGDAEKLKFDKRFDLIISASTFQWFQNIDIVFENISKMLNKEGLIVFNSFVSGNFVEIKKIKEGGLSYMSYSSLEQLLKKHFDIVYSENAKHQIYFNSAVEILNHLRLTGVNGTKAKRAWTKTDLRNFEDKYKEFFYSDKGYSLTYNPAYFVCKPKCSI